MMGRPRLLLALQALLLLHASLASATISSARRRSTSAARRLGPDGILMLYPSVNDDMSWYSAVSWATNRSLTVGATQQADPYDNRSWTYSGGSIKISNGVMVQKDGTVLAITNSRYGWADLELTAYARNPSGSNGTSAFSGYTLEARSGGENASDPCSFRSYLSKLYFQSRQMGLQKRYTQSLYSGSVRTATGAVPYAAFVSAYLGMKMVVRSASNGSTVQVDLYVDYTEGANGGTWQRVLQRTDTNDWQASSTVSSCTFPDAGSYSSSVANILSPGKACVLTVTSPTTGQAGQNAVAISVKDVAEEDDDNVDQGRAARHHLWNEKRSSLDDNAGVDGTSTSVFDRTCACRSGHHAPPDNKAPDDEAPDRAASIDNRSAEEYCASVYLQETTGDVDHKTASDVYTCCPSNNRARATFVNGSPTQQQAIVYDGTARDDIEARCCPSSNIAGTCQHEAEANDTANIGTGGDVAIGNIATQHGTTSWTAGRVDSRSVDVIDHTNAYPAGDDASGNVDGSVHCWPACSTDDDDDVGAGVAHSYYAAGADHPAFTSAWSCAPLDLSRPQTTLGPASNSLWLKVAPNRLAVGTVYNFTFSICIAGPPSRYASCSLAYRLITPDALPFGGNLSVTPLVAYELSTFTIRTAGWRSTGRVCVRLVAIVDAANGQLPLNGGSCAPAPATIDTMLPLGLPDDNHTLTVQAIAYDELTGVGSTPITIQCQCRPRPSTTTTTPADLVSLVMSSSRASLLSAVQAGAAFLNALPPAVSDQDGRERRQARADLLAAVIASATAPTNTTTTSSSLTAQATALHVVMSGPPDEISQAVAETSLQFMVDVMNGTTTTPSAARLPRAGRLVIAESLSAVIVALGAPTATSSDDVVVAVGLLGQAQVADLVPGEPHDAIETGQFRSEAWKVDRATNRATTCADHATNGYCVGLPDTLPAMQDPDASVGVLTTIWTVSPRPLPNGAVSRTVSVNVMIGGDNARRPVISNLSDPIQIGIATTSTTPSSSVQHALVCVSAGSGHPAPWTTDGCRLAGSAIQQINGTTSAICECTHLTDFAIVDDQRRHDADSTTSLYRQTGTIYLFFVWVYAGELAVVIAVALEGRQAIVKEAARKSLRLTSSLIATLCLVRIVSSVLYASGLWDVASHAIFIVLALAPPIVQFLLLSFYILMLAATARKIRTMSTAKLGLFQGMRAPFLFANATMVVVVPSLLVAGLLLPVDVTTGGVLGLSLADLLVSAASSVACLTCLALGVMFLWFGARLRQLLLDASRDAPGNVASTSSTSPYGKVARSLARMCTAFCVCLCVQSCLWLVSVVDFAWYLEHYSALHSLYLTCDATCIALAVLYNRNTVAVSRSARLNMDSTRMKRVFFGLDNRPSGATSKRAQTMAGSPVSVGAASTPLRTVQEAGDDNDVDVGAVDQGRAIQVAMAESWDLIRNAAAGPRHALTGGRHARIQTASGLEVEVVPLQDVVVVKPHVYNDHELEFMVELVGLVRSKLQARPAWRGATLDEVMTESRSIAETVIIEWRTNDLLLCMTPQLESRVNALADASRC
ncbi:unnamed protein product (mitochondrion) [Plasmodiophora brassicae]|uniref:GAIN-B domain-containing protein n=1 Tax=Plasmodiophora brassicae TaxID=37360 RepID=A0A3P3YMU3_PLABS|nr:unnamed protein product [Plasmodiophora brassicae]